MAEALAAPAGTPGQAYQRGVDAGHWQDDPAQRAVLPHLDRLYEVLSPPGPRQSGLLERLLGRDRRQRAAAGLYLWGRVGRGKTFLLDLLAGQLPGGIVLREHFHRFMAQIHAALRERRELGQDEPLDRVAAAIAERCRLLCLDEFNVTDIGDAMLLSGLLSGLFRRGVLLATTSNTPPGELYRDGLQRSRFLPAIALIQSHCHVVELVSPTDWRLRSLTRAPVHLVPADAGNEQRLRERFLELAQGQRRFDTSVLIEGRRIPARGLGGDVAWFDFSVLCDGPRSVADYIELARSYGTVLISGVPQFGAPDRDDAARRFIHLVDEFYERRVKLLLTAQVPVTQLYPPVGRLRALFERTESRLIQMQSREYLAQEHRP